jgi:hypothetical protein
VAIYSLHVKTVSRSDGRSVVAAAAYRAAENIGDDRLGVVWDFTRKSGVLHAEILTPAGAPEWAQDRAELWNAAERAEDKSTRRSAATTGRDIILALPHASSPTRNEQTRCVNLPRRSLRGTGSPSTSRYTRPIGMAIRGTTTRIF